MLRALPKVAGVLLLAQACGAPSVPAPDAGNPGIEFVSDSMTPRNGSCLEPSGVPACESVVLTAGAVLDPDVEENLFARWFVDGTVTEMALLRPGSSPSVRRSIAQQLSLSPQRLIRGAHVVKVVVSDGFAAAGEDFTQVAEGKTSAEWAWCLDTSGCENGAAE